MLLSGGSNGTAIVYTSGHFGSFDTMRLAGHQGPVMAIATTKTGNIVTGGADSFIIFWNRTGLRFHGVKAHQQGVRSLAVLPDDTLLSGGDDALIKCWAKDGVCLKSFHGNTNSIYSLALNPFLGENVFLSCEHSSIRMWNKCVDINEMAKLKPFRFATVNPNNGDIILSLCDGIVKIFTMDPARYADAKTIAEFDAAVEARKRQAELLLVDVEINKNPGKNKKKTVF